MEALARRRKRALQPIPVAVPALSGVPSLYRIRHRSRRLKDIEIGRKHPSVSRDIALANTKLDIMENLKRRLKVATAFEDRCSDTGWEADRFAAE